MSLLTRFLSWLKWMVQGQRLETEMETELHSYARQLLAQGKVGEAWQVLLALN